MSGSGYRITPPVHSTFRPDEDHPYDHGVRVPNPPRSKAVRPRPAFQTEAHPANRMGGSAVQKQAQWLSRAAEADRAGDAVQAELCRQYAEHWFRVSRGQE